MIADLLARELSPRRWGPKAARLSRAARHGIPVPQGLCLDTAQAAAPLGRRQAVVSSWLTARRPPAVVVRSSATVEDGELSSSAGRFLTIRDIAPETTAVLEAARRVQDRLAGVPGASGSVILQQQLPAELMGVTFTQADGTLLTEGSPVAAAVTDGAPPAFRMRHRGGGYTVRGALDTVPPALLALHLRRLVHALQEIFDFPLDIEWASLAGQLFLLQVRPVTIGLPDARTVDGAAPAVDR